MKTDYDSSLLIIRLQNRASDILGSKVLASFFLLYFPLIAVGIGLQLKFEYRIFSRGVLLSTLWLGLAPLLIQDALRVITEFFDNHKHLFNDESAWHALKESSLEKLESPRYIVFAIPWALATTTTILYCLFLDAPMFIQAWVALTYFIMFFLSAIGFQGIILVTKIISLTLKQEIAFNPFHPDSFGGLQTLSNFLVKGTLYFSTGSLALPLVFEMVGKLSESSEIFNYSVYLLTGLFITLLIYSFLKPIINIKNFISDMKEYCIIESQKKIKALYADLEKDNDNISNAIKLYAYNELYHRKLSDIKEYPYDLSVIAELAFALIIPISISALEKYWF